MADLATAGVIGSWRVLRTEIPPPYNPEHEFFHFSPDGIHYWEYPFLTQLRRVFRFRFEITADGARLSTLNGTHYRDLPLHFDGDLLVMTGTHGYSSWLERISETARPSYLTHFYEPPNDADYT